MSFPLWAAVAVIGAEYFLFSVGFDSAEFRQRADAWRLAGYLGSLAVVVAAAVMGVILAGQVQRHRRSVFSVARRLDGFALTALAAHAASAAVLWWLTSRVLSPSGPPPGPAVAWLALWFLTAFATPLFCGAAALSAVGPLRVLLSTLVGGVAIGVGAWLAGQGSALFWQPLGPWTLAAVERCLSLLLDHTYFDPANSVIGSDRFQVVLTRQCSGFEGIGLITVFVTAYLLLARRDLRFPQALLLLPLGVAASLTANVVRIVALILVGTSISPSIAVSGFHARAGWLFFSVLVFMLLLLSRRLPFFTSTPNEINLSHPTAAYLLPFVALVGVALVSGLVTASMDWMYGLRIAAAVAVLLAFRRHYAELRGSWSWTAATTGLVAAVAFVALAPRPEASHMQAWHDEWQTLPAWARFSWTLVRGFGSVLVVPLVEELAFRGYLLRRLIARDFEDVSPRQVTVSALLVSSVAFGGIHAGWVAGSIAGLLFSLIHMHGQGVRDAVVAHVVSNAVVALCVLGFGQWWLWM